MPLPQKNSINRDIPSSRRRIAAFSITLAALALVLCTSTAIAAYGHAVPVSYSIEPNTVFENPGLVPSVLVISFSERPDPKTSYVHVLNSRNERVDNNDFSITSPNAREVTITVDQTKLQDDSIYSVSWRTFSLDDGHITEGAYVFGIGEIGDISSAGPGSEQTRYVTSTADALLKWPLIVAQTAIVGGAFTHLFLWKSFQSKRNDDIKRLYEVKTSALPRRLAVILVASASAIAAFGTALVFVQASYLATADNSDYLSIVQAIIFGSPSGFVWMLRIATSSAIIAIAIGYYVRAKTKERSLQTAVFLVAILAAGAVSIFSNSMLSHNAASPILPQVAIFSDWLHFMAVSAWVGGLFYFSAVATGMIKASSKDARELHRNLSLVIPRFSILATISLGIIGITGIYMAWIHIHDFDFLFGTAYGTNLIVKLSAAVPMIALGGYHQLILHKNMVVLATDGRQHASEGDRTGRNENAASRFAKTVRIESFIGVAVLLAASFLTITSPPSQEHHQAGGSDAGFHLTTTVDNVDITFEISPFQVGVNTFDVSLRNEAGQAPSNIQTTFMRFTNTDAGVGPIITTLDNKGGGSYSTTGAYLGQQGIWKIDFIAQRTGAYDLNYSFEGTLTAASVSNGDSHSEHEQSLQEESTDMNQEAAAIPPSESFTLAAIILSIGVAAISAYSVVRSRQQLRRTVASLRNN